MHAHADDNIRNMCRFMLPSKTLNMPQSTETHAHTCDSISKLGSAVLPKETVPKPKSINAHTYAGKANGL